MLKSLLYILLVVVLILFWPLFISCVAKVYSILYKDFPEKLNEIFGWEL